MKAFLNRISPFNIVLIAASMVMAIVLVVNITSAFFSAKSDGNTSSIIIGNFALEAYFKEGENQSTILTIPQDRLIAGEIITKTLVIKIPSDSDPAYVRIRGVFEVNAGSGFEANNGVQVRVNTNQVGTQATRWTKGRALNNEESPAINPYYYYNSSVGTPDEGDELIEVNIEFVVYPTADNNNYYLDSSLAGKPYRALIYIDAVQDSYEAHEEWGEDRPATWISGK